MATRDDHIDAEELLRIVLDSIPLRVFWKDLDLNFLGANRKLLDDIGFSSLDELVGQSDYVIFDDPADAEPKRADDRDVINSGEGKLDIEEPLPIDGKDLRWLNTNKVPMRNSHGEIIGVLGTYEDITEKVEYRKLIEKQANIDPLTGLANRRKLESSITASEFDFSFLLFIDLDHFKHVNDTLGHAVGDEILQQTAQRLQRVADEHGALLARLGGDEFSIFKTVDSAADMSAESTPLATQVLATLSESFLIGSHVISSIGASIGIACVEGKEKHVSNGFIEADIAMYCAKANGRNNFQFFSEELREKTARRHTLLNSLHKAIEKDELSLVFQPQMDRTGALIGAEALLRWHNSELGNVPPDEFISIAEESGLIHAIGDWVIDEAIATLSKWKCLLEDIPNFKLAINVSGTQFQNMSLVSSICQRMAENDVQPRNLTIEVTESVLFDSNETNQAIVNHLKKEGFTVDIDDFGTGYSSLSQLSSLPIDTIKIDKSFIRHIDSNRNNRKIVQTVINMADELGVRIVAEGVETSAEREVVDSLGCVDYQGYLFGKPAAFNEFTTLYLEGSPEHRRAA